MERSSTNRHSGRHWMVPMMRADRAQVTIPAQHIRSLHIARPPFAVLRRSGPAHAVWAGGRMIGAYQCPANMLVHTTAQREHVIQHRYERYPNERAPRKHSGEPEPM